MHRRVLSLGFAALHSIARERRHLADLKSNLLPLVLPLLGSFVILSDIHLVAIESRRTNQKNFECSFFLVYNSRVEERRCSFFALWLADASAIAGKRSSEFHRTLTPALLAYEKRFQVSAFFYGLSIFLELSRLLLREFSLVELEIASFWNFRRENSSELRHFYFLAF